MNQYSKVNNNLCRTNNIVEAWHRAISSLFDGKYPSFWKFIEEIKKTLQYQCRIIEQIIVGKTQTPSKRKYRFMKERFLKLVRRFEELSLDDYLRAVAQNFIY